MECKKVVVSPEGYKICADTGEILSFDTIVEDSWDNIEDYIAMRRPRFNSLFKHNNINWILTNGFCEKFRESPTKAIREFRISAKQAYYIARKYCGYIPRKKIHLKHEDRIITWKLGKELLSLGLPITRVAEIIAAHYGIHPITVYRLLRG